MMEPVTLKYRAFLSYAHADAGWAKWLHKNLESFRIDKDLAGRATAHGAVPAALRPIFRDRDDFSGGHTLTAATIAALDQSHALIVLCSPVAAMRPAVNEEVRLFRSRHPTRPVIPVIIDGTYPENFPPALRFEIDADGSITERPVTLLGPDLRETGEGKDLGLAKVVAGLVGVSSDDIYRRAERARRQRNRIKVAVASVFLLLAAGGGFFAWQNWHKQQTLTEIEALVARYSPIGEAQAAPVAGTGLKEAIARIAEGAAADPRYAEALVLLKDGRPKEAEPLLAAVAEDKKKRAQKNSRDAAAAYRDLATIKKVSDPKSAREAYAEAAKLDPEHVEGLFYHGWFQKEAGNLDDAESAFRSVVSIAKAGADDRWLYWARLGLGDIQVQRGDLSVGKSTYSFAAEVAERLTKADPANAGWQRDLSVSHDRIGDVLRAQGNLPAALDAFNASLAIAERLTKADPANAGWQFDLGIGNERIGDVLMAQGDLDAALKSYRAKQDIISRLAKADPANADWQRDLSVSHNSIGDVLRAQGNLPAALDAFNASLAIRDRLAKADPTNAGWQRDLSVSHNKIGDVLVEQGNLVQALDAFKTSLAIADRLASADPANAGWQRDLSVYQEKIGDVLIEQGNLAQALDAFKASLAIAERLAEADPANAGWQRDLAVSNERLADIHGKKGAEQQAREALERALSIYEGLMARNPDDVPARVFSVVPRMRLADLDPANARKHLTDALAILKPLAAEGRLDAVRLEWIPQLEAQLAALDKP